MSDLLLINPPLWNAYAPHLAVPLLLGIAKERGFQARGMDLSAEAMDYLLSATGLTALHDRLRDRSRARDSEVRRRAERGLMLLEHVIADIESAKKTIRSVAGLGDPEATAVATTTLRNALWVCSAAFDGARIDLAANDLYYSARSSAAVMAATTDPERNVYRWAFEQMGLADTFRRLDPAVLGISVSADTQLMAAMTIARMARETGWRGHLVLGGNYVTRIASRWTQRHPFFDLADSMVLYEGEEAITAICDREVRGVDTPVPGALWAVGDLLERTPTRNVALDTIPPPDYGDFDLTKYFAPGPVLPTYASRSCAWDCAFCSIPFASNKFRARKADRIVDEMETLRARHRTSYFYLVDEIATSHSLRELSDELIRRRSDLKWYAETRFSKAWTPPLTQRLYDSGCRRLSLGLESYNQRVLDRMRKRIRVDVVQSNMESFLGAGIPIHLFCIIGFPGETAAEAQKTIDFATAACSRSRDEFGVEETTWAAAPFVLDLHSPVGQQPAEFGVEIIPPPEDEDLALTVAYRILEEGLSQDDNWRLMRGAEGVEDAGLPDDPFWFDFPAIRHVEERLFLRASHDMPADPPTEAMVTWAGAADRLVLDPRAVWSERAVYSPTADAVMDVAFTDDMARILRGGGTMAELAAALRPVTGADVEDRQRMLAAMIRLGVLQGGKSVVLRDEWLGECTVRREVGARGRFDPTRGQGYLWSRSVGGRVRVGPAGFGLFLLSEHGFRTDDDRLRALPPAKDKHIGLLRLLVSHRFLYVDRAETDTLGAER